MKLKGRELIKEQLQGSKKGKPINLKEPVLLGYSKLVVRDPKLRQYLKDKFGLEADPLDRCRCKSNETCVICTPKN